MDVKDYKTRRYARYQVDIEVLIRGQGEPIRGRITQISRGGCLIFPALPPDMPAHVGISFRLREGTPPIDCTGEIIYSIFQRGSGVALSDISEDDQEAISEFFEKAGQS